MHRRVIAASIIAVLVLVYLVHLRGDRCAGTSPLATGAPLAGYNLILINIDTLRADHLGAYGYARDTSPQIDRLAAQGVLFEQAISASTYTRESVAALLTGLLPSSSGSVGWHAAPGLGTPVLGEYLAGAGFRSAFLFIQVMLKRPGFSRGFEVRQSLPAWDVSGMGPRLSRLALDFVEAHANERFALYLHYLDPHAPYEPREVFYRRFADERLSEPVELHDAESQRELAALRRDGFGPGDPRFEDMLLRYDAEIAATDAALQQLFVGLQRLEVLNSTLVVLTADHGEEFLEHGFVDHGWTLYEEVLRVPLLFWAPGVLEPQRVPGRVSQVDVLPTVLDLLGIPAEPRAFDGESLFERRGDALVPRTRQRPQVAELLIPERNLVRTAIEGRWKYVAAVRWLEPQQRAAADVTTADPWSKPVREELFDLRADPAEQRNRLAEVPDLHRQLAEVLERHRQASRERGLVGAKPPPRISPEDAETLRELGYH